MRISDWSSDVCSSDLLPRTGTTLTINLLSADPGRRCLLRWEALNPAPPAKKGELQTDLRCGAERQKLAMMLQLAPHIAAAHWEEADGPSECQYAMQLSFCAQIFDSTLHLPSYGQWFLREADYLRSEEHTSELQSLMRISYAVFCLNKKTTSSSQQ